MCLGEKLWSNIHLREIIECFGALVIGRNSSMDEVRSDEDAIIKELEMLGEVFRKNVLVVEDPEESTRQLSSTAIRDSVAEGLSIAGSTLASVIDYIAKHNLYCHCHH